VIFWLGSAIPAARDASDSPDRARVGCKSGFDGGRLTEVLLRTIMVCEGSEIRLAYEEGHLVTLRPLKIGSMRERGLYALRLAVSAQMQTGCRRGGLTGGEALLA
jgi:hypothetical protein